MRIVWRGVVKIVWRGVVRIVWRGCEDCVEGLGLVRIAWIC